VSPLYFFPENLRTFFSLQFCGVIPGFFFSLLLKTWRPFFCSSLSLSLSLFIAFTRVSPPPRCHPTPFLPVRPHFSTILCKFAHKKMFSFGCHPPGGCHPGRSAPSPLVTPLTVFKVIRQLEVSRESPKF